MSPLYALIHNNAIGHKAKKCVLIFCCFRGGGGMMCGMKIGIMGVPGSFSEAAANMYIQEEGISDATLVPLVSTQSVLDALDAGEIECGLFGIENSNGGMVLESLDAMASHTFTIERLVELDVHHMLLVRPRVVASQITKITSHDQALKQCRMYLQRAWQTVGLEPYEDSQSSGRPVYWSIA